MGPPVSVEQAKDQLLELLGRVAAGEEIVLEVSGRAVARLVPVRTQPRKPGRLRGKIKIADDFDEPLPEGIATAFRGEHA